MSAVNQLARFGVVTTTVLASIAPAAARPFLGVKMNHLMPVVSIDLSKGRSLNVGGLGPVGSPSVHVSNDKGFLGGLVNTVDDTVHAPADAINSVIEGTGNFFHNVSNFLTSPKMINETIHDGFGDLMRMISDFIAHITPYLMTLSIALPISVLVGFLLLGLILRPRTRQAGV